MVVSDGDDGEGRGKLIMGTHSYLERIDGV